MWQDELKENATVREQVVRSSDQDIFCVTAFHLVKDQKLIVEEHISGMIITDRVCGDRCQVYYCYLSPKNSHWGRDSASSFAHLMMMQLQLLLVGISMEE